MDHSQPEFFITLHSNAKGYTFNETKSHFKFENHLCSPLHLPHEESWRCALHSITFSSQHFHEDDANDAEDVSSELLLVRLQEINQAFTNDDHILCHARRRTTGINAIHLAPRFKYFYPLQMEWIDVLHLHVLSFDLKELPARLCESDIILVFHFKKMSHSMTETLPLRFRSGATTKYPENTPSNFRVTLPHHYNIFSYKHWRVALGNISFKPVFWPLGKNITSCNVDLLTYDPNDFKRVGEEEVEDRFDDPHREDEKQNSILKTINSVELNAGDDGGGYGRYESLGIGSLNVRRLNETETAIDFFTQFKLGLEKIIHSNVTSIPFQMVATSRKLFFRSVSVTRKTMIIAPEWLFDILGFSSDQWVNYDYDGRKALIFDRVRGVNPFFPINVERLIPHTMYVYLDCIRPMPFGNSLVKKLALVPITKSTIMKSSPKKSRYVTFEPSCLEYHSIPNNRLYDMHFMLLDQNNNEINLKYNEYETIISLFLEIN